VRRFTKVYSKDGITLAMSTDGQRLRLELPSGWAVQSFFNGPGGGKLRLMPVPASEDLGDDVLDE